MSCSSPWGWVSAGAAAACVVGAFAFAGLHYVHPPVEPAAPTQSKAPAQAIAPNIADTGNSAAHAELVSDEQKLSALESELAEAEKKAKEFKIAAVDAKHEVEGAEAQQQQALNQRDSLSRQLAAAQSEAQSLREKLVSVQSGTGQQTMLISELQAKVQHLNAVLDDANTTLESKDRMLAFDKDLMLHDRDIRDVIGARNLYIADIYDTNSNGATAKPFGRIFYTKDSSLVFYGFDLEKQSGTKQPVAFQAWGSGTDRRPVSLGLFYQDDGHKRWVLKCNDPSTLARLNMVFVTIEPPGGSNKPTGKQFLRAYLQIQANHP